MLIDEPLALMWDPILGVIAAMASGGQSRRLRQGVYEIGHFGASHFMLGYDHWPDIEPCSFGVCDSVEQLIERIPALESSDREFVVTMNLVSRASQPREGGWRWHKWGDYIGEKEPRCEYLHDEPEIERVYVFHIYERKGTS